MERVWLSTSYYLDPKVINLSADAERMFTRGLAYCGAAETRGFIPDSALTQLGNKRGSRPVHELTGTGLWTKVDGGYQVSSWHHWQKNGDDLLERRRKDRERQARKRKSVRGQSRDMSRDVTGGEESREEEKRSTYVDQSSHVGNADANDERPTGPAINVEGWKLVRDIIPASHPQATKSMLAQEAGGLILGGTPSDDIRAALELWLTKPNLGPRTLPSLVSEVIRTRDRPHPTFTRPTGTASTADQRFAQAQALKDSNGSAWPGSPLEIT